MSQSVCRDQSWEFLSRASQTERWLVESIVSNRLRTFSFHIPREWDPAYDGQSIKSNFQWLLTVCMQHVTPNIAVKVPKACLFWHHWQIPYTPIVVYIILYIHSYLFLISNECLDQVVRLYFEFSLILFCDSWMQFFFNLRQILLQWFLYFFTKHVHLWGYFVLFQIWNAFDLNFR